jgi:hypothetical protein
LVSSLAKQAKLEKVELHLRVNCIIWIPKARMPDVKKSKAMNTLQTSLISLLEIWVWCFEIKDSMLTCSFYKPLLSPCPVYERLVWGSSSIKYYYLEDLLGYYALQY